MDWYSWLAKSNLDPSLVSNYSLLFSDNELDASDAAYFDHEVLKSMGITIAKHRLEILKLSKLEKRKPPSLLFARLLATMRSTKEHFSSYIRSFAHRNDSAIVIVPKHSCNGRRGSPSTKRSKKLVSVVHGRLMLTNGCMNASESIVGLKSVSRTTRNCRKAGTGEGGADEIIRWDFMFHDLKPT